MSEKATPIAEVVPVSVVADRYLDLLAACLTRSAFPETWNPVIHRKGSWRAALMAPLDALLRARDYHVCKRFEYDPKLRAAGLDWPPEAETMVGTARLANIRNCCIRSIQDDIPGDFCETGVWRGGSCIYMRGIIEALEDKTRSVWVCDSFEGLPEPSVKEDKGLDLSVFRQLAISMDQVKSNFARYGLLDDRVKFLKGWFRDSLPKAPIERLAVARLDGDLYESTWDGLVNLYPKLSPGGFLIVDDYHTIAQCAQAVQDYRKKHGIVEPIEEIDGSGVFWRRARA